MNQNNLLATLQENRLMQTEEQVTNFENALAEIAENPDENNLYYAYIDNNETKEIYKYDSNILSESISCYKDKNIPKLFKLQAINTLIENGLKSF